MTLRVAGLAGIAVVLLAAVATVPTLARPASVERATSARPVPVYLVGLLLDECVGGLVLPEDVTVAIEPEAGGVRFVLERGSSSSVDPTAFPIVDFTPEEAVFREELEACTSPHPVSLAEGLPAEEVAETAYQEYRQRRLLPCLATHGVVPVETENGLASGRYDWYLTSLYELADLERAVDAWYDCPPLPTYLDVD